MKNGFTLVELSIVLVIIGLLIGGILVGQSLIESAQLNSFVRQVQQLDIAASNFRNKYRCLPGDDNKFTPSGNCDGNIFSSLLTDSRYDSEIASYWLHLVNSGSLSGDLTGLIVSSQFENGVTFPEAEIGEDCGFLVGQGTSGDTVSSIIKGNIYSIHRFTLTNSGSGTFRASPCLTTAIALSIDSKIDDGHSWDGDIVAGWVDNNEDLTTGNSSFNDCYDSSGAYKIDNSGEICGLHIKLLKNNP